MELIAILGIAFVVFMIFAGYVLNIIKLIKISSFNGECIVRTCGIFFFPLGVIMGFIK